MFKLNTLSFQGKAIEMLHCFHKMPYVKKMPFLIAYAQKRNKNQSDSSTCGVF